MGFEIRADCRHYQGYKPCGRHPFCEEECAAFEPKGEQILIIKLGAMGDVLRTTPLLRVLREKHDPCFITWLTDPESEVLLRYNPLVDRVLTWGHDASLILQAQRFDLLLDFEKEPRALALDALVQASVKRGFALHPAGGLGVHNGASEYALRLGIDDELKFRDNRKPMPQILSEMAELPYGREEYVLEIGKRAAAFGQAFARKHGLDGSHKVIGLNTGCGAVFPTKQWPEKHFAELIELLHRKSEAVVLLLGGPREREMNLRLMAGAPAKAVVNTGCDNALEDFLGLVDVCDLVVTSDSLAMHVAIARQKLVLALLGSTSVSEIDVYDRGEILCAGMDCSPCYRKECRKPITCMEAITPKQVFEAIRRLMN